MLGFSAEGTDFQMYVWRSVLFSMPSKRGCQSLQSTYENNFKRILGKGHVGWPYIGYKAKKEKFFSEFFATSFFEP